MSKTTKTKPTQNRMKTTDTKTREVEIEVINDGPEPFFALHIPGSREHRLRWTKDGLCLEKGEGLDTEKHAISLGDATSFLAASLQSMGIFEHADFEYDADGLAQLFWKISESIPKSPVEISKHLDRRLQLCVALLRESAGHDCPL
jgi:hypothetical protein